MPSADELLLKIDQLKGVAETHERQQARARAQEERARLELESATEKLAKLFGMNSWAEAEQLLPQLRQEAEAQIEHVQSVMSEAGLL